MAAHLLSPEVATGGPLRPGLGRLLLFFEDCPGCPRTVRAFAQRFSCTRFPPLPESDRLWIPSDQRGVCGKVSHVIASPLLEGFARDSTTVYFPVTETEKVPDVGATRGRHSRRGGALRNPTTYAR